MTVKIWLWRKHDGGPWLMTHNGWSSPRLLGSKPWLVKDSNTFNCFLRNKTVKGNSWTYFSQKINSRIRTRRWKINQFLQIIWISNFCFFILMVIYLLFRLSSGQKMCLHLTLSSPAPTSLMSSSSASLNLLFNVL